METFVELVGWMFALPSTRLFLAATLAVALISAKPLSHWTDWSATGIAITICGLGGALAVTFVNRLGVWDLKWAPESVSACLGQISRSWGTPEALLNLCMLIPLGVGLALASRNAVLSASLIVATAISIELLQSMTGLGACQRGDMVRNAIGGLAAVAVTVLVARLWHDDEIRPMLKHASHKRIG